MLKKALAPSDDAGFWKLTPRPPLTRGLSTELTGGESPVPFSHSAGEILQLFSPSVKNLRFLPPPSSEGGWRFGSFATPVERSSEGGMKFFDKQKVLPHSGAAPFLCFLGEDYFPAFASVRSLRP